MSTDTLTAEAIVDSQMREWERVGIDLQEPDRRDTLLGLARAARQPLEERVRELEEALADGIEAFRLTREYVGEDTLPAIEGWSWFDWCEQARAALREPVR